MGRTLSDESPDYPLQYQICMNDPSKETSIDSDDQHLMATYCTGDANAFKHLYDKYEQPIYRFLYNGCHNDAQARELFQDIWLRVVKSRDTYNPEAPFKAWLFTIARNRLTDHYRQQSACPPEHHGYPHGCNEHDGESDGKDIHPHAFASAALTPEQMASVTEQNETLKNALHTLPPAQREAVMLKHIAGMNLDEIATIQGEGRQTVKSRLRYAMIKLRQHLKELS